MKSLSDLKRTLLTGLFIVGPVSLTFILLAWFVAFIDGLVQPALILVGRPVPGLGALAAFAIVLIAGIVGSNMVGQHLLEYVDELCLRIPVFNWLYRTIKQVSEVFSPDSKTKFRRVVLVEYPRPGCYSIGFVTNEVALDKSGQRKPLLCVYVPTNHMYIGDLLLLPPESAIETALTQQDGVQAALSAGAALPRIIPAR